MQSRKEALDYGLAFPDTYVETPFRDTNWQLVRVKCSKKAFLWIYEKDGYVNLNVKADKEWRDYWRSAFKSVIPGWHQNKENWNTIILDGLVPDDAIKTMIKESYELVTDNPTKRIYEAVKKIPKGCVATYGQIAELAGNKGMARAVMHFIEILTQIIYHVTGLLIPRENCRVHLHLAVQDNRSSCLRQKGLK